MLPGTSLQWRTFRLSHGCAMEITEQLLGDCSPYIANLVYDIDVRMLFIECFDDPETQNPVARIVFPGILSYAETSLIKDPEDDTIDDLVSVEQIDPRTLVITTYKKEIVLTLTEEPFVEDIE